MKTKIKIKAAALLGAGLALAGCSTTTQDLKGIRGEHPDSVHVYQAPDGFPNISVTCVYGVAFVSTTRDYQQTTYVEALNWTCPQPAGAPTPASGAPR